MVGRVRWPGVLTVLLAVTFGLALWTGGPAQAAPKPQPTTLTISPAGSQDSVTVHSDTDATLFAALFDQVSWLRAGTGQGSPAAGTDLGRKYTVVISVGDQARQTYDLYPLAKGGPRAYRPSVQPDQRTTTAAWFYGRLNMTDALRTAGLPLPGEATTITGGIGGGEPATDVDALDPSAGFTDALGDLRRVLLLNTGVIVAITLGLAGIALLIRRRTR